jgi:hypothetical protein
MRLTSDFFVSAYIRQCGIEGVFAGLRRRGGAEAGAIFIVVDLLDGTGVIYGPAPQTSYEEGPAERAFTRLHKAPVLERPEIEARLEKEIAFDSDCWIVEVEDREGRHFLQSVV